MHPKIERQLADMMAPLASAPDGVKLMVRGCYLDGLLTALQLRLEEEADVIQLAALEVAAERIRLDRQARDLLASRLYREAGTDGADTLGPTRKGGG